MSGIWVQQSTKGSLTEAWTDGRHAETTTMSNLDYELVVALANVTEGAARATILSVTHAEQWVRGIASTV